MNTIRRMSLISVFVCAVMALAGCGKKTPPAPEPDTTVPINDKVITPPVGTPKDKDGKPKETPITDAGKDAPVLDAVALTRELSKNPASAERYENKVVRIEGVVTRVDLKHDGSGTSDAFVVLATDSSEESKNLVIWCYLRDKPGAAKVGPGQKVILRGNFTKLSNVISLGDAIVEKAGPVAYTQVELDKIRKEEPKAIAELQRLKVEHTQMFNPPIYDVTLSDAQLTPDGAIKPEVLAPISRLLKVDSLTLSRTRISNEGLMGLEKLVRLRQLNLHDVKNLGVQGLSALKKVRGLEKLLLYDTPLSDAGLAPLSDLVQLTSLDLMNTGITDAGLIHLSKLSHLETLQLGKNKISDAGLAHLAKAPKLENLNLEGTTVGDAGLEHLAGVKTLTRLSLSKKTSKVTEAGMKKLKTALPKLNIDLSDD
jgi:Leucine-rich repeat (LRR) protein